MSRFLQGLLIVLYVLVVNAVVAFIETGAASSTDFANCGGEDGPGNATECANVGETSFFNTLADVSFTGPAGFPSWMSTLYVIIHGLLLTGAILLIVLAFVPLTSS